jgi:putative tricarboxylic transport membrane protein
MDLFSNLALGFAVALSASALWWCAVGVTLGTLIGVLPGIGPLASIGILLPLTFHLPPTEAIIMLAGIYYGSMYGGSTAAILLNLPGTAGAVVACFGRLSNGA